MVSKYIIHKHSWLNEKKIEGSKSKWKLLVPVYNTGVNIKCQYGNACATHKRNETPKVKKEKQNFFKR